MIRKASLLLLGLGFLLLLLPVVLEVRWFVVAANPPRDLTLPSLPLKTLDGRTVNLRDYLGVPLVVNLWASWCPPCRRELPMMVRVAEEGGVLFLFVNVNEAPDRVRGFLGEARVEPSRWTRFLLGDEAVVRATYVRGLPTTFFFDSRGEMRERHLGEIDEETLRGKLEVVK